MVRWADPDRVADAVAAYAASVRSKHPQVSRILWYGSWVTGGATPSSDVDLCVVVRSDSRRPRDRIPDYMPDRFSTGLDLLVLTEEELGALATRSPTWHEAIVSGRAV